MFSHRDPHALSPFIHIRTAAGSMLRATPGHYVWAAQQANESSATLVKAGSLQLGEYVWAAFGDSCRNSLLPSKVVELSTELSRGLYNPHTASGSIVVDGIAAATFTDTLPASVAFHTAVTFPARILYQLLCFRALREQANNFLLSAWQTLTSQPRLHALPATFSQSA